MKAPFLGHTWNGVCTHKDMDHSCGCVSCTYCDLIMIECDQRATGLPCAPREEIRPLSQMLENLANWEHLGPQWKTDEELARITELEARLIAGEEIVMYYYGRRVRHTL